MSLSSTNNLYSFPQPYTRVFPAPIIAQRAPTTSDISFPSGQMWVDQAGNQIYFLIEVVSGVASWEIAAGTSSHPITPFVVGSTGGYSTIQSALNAANTAGGGIVYVQPGTYTENLTLFGTTAVVGVAGNSDAGTTGNTITIVGVHTPPTTGSFNFSNVKLQSSTHIFSSSAAGSASLNLLNCIVAITSGFIFNLANWTGDLIAYNVADSSTNNGVVTNSGGSSCFFISATLGNGTGQTMSTTGSVTLEEVDLKCPWSAATGTVINCNYTNFSQTVTAANNSTGSFLNCIFNTGATPALTMSSSAAINIRNSSITSSNNPAITGAGAGTLTLGGVDFTSNTTTAGTLTIGAVDAFKAGTFQSFGNITAVTAGSGIVVPVATAVGSTPVVLNSRAGTVQFQSISIAAAATKTIVMTNNKITDANTIILYTLRGVTTGAALSIQSVINTAGSSSIVITNGTGATTSTENIFLDFLILN